MKRPAICFCLGLSIVCLSVGGWAGVGHAKGRKNNGQTNGHTDAPPAAADPNSAPADTAAAPAADPNAAPAPDPNAAPAPDPNAADANAAPADTAPAPGGETVTPEGDETANGALPVETDAGKKTPPTLSWQDIVVVPRKAFLKGSRLEVAPMAGISINDNLIRHYSFGGSLNFFLSDVLSVGLEGQYFIKALTGTEENVGLQYNRIPTLNKYLYEGALTFGYSPIYGKFTWFNKQIVHWEIFASAGVGAIVSETIPRNPGEGSFKNNLLTVPIGLGSRFFLFDWLTLNVAVRDYILDDNFEPANRGPDGSPSPYLDPMTNMPIPWSTKLAQDKADHAFVHNVMVYAGVGIYLPTKFQYRTPR
jgi:outer membrane beta-barrel protein